MSIGERVVEALGKPYDIGGIRILVPATVGVARAGADDRTAPDRVAGG